MPTFTEIYTLAVERLLGDQGAGPGRHIAYLVESAKLIGADRANDSIQLLSGDLSAFPVPMAPLGVSAPPMLLMVCTDQPIDIVISATSMQLFVLAGFVSNVWITTGALATTMMLKAAGGSGASLQCTFPLP